MANEIAVLDRDPNEGRARVLFLYLIASPKQVNGANVVPTPSANLPDLAKIVLLQAEKDALDAGTSAFGVHTFPVPTTTTNQEAATFLKTKWAIYDADFQTQYTARYSRTGTRISAP